MKLHSCRVCRRRSWVSRSPSARFKGPARDLQLHLVNDQFCTGRQQAGSPREAEDGGRSRSPSSHPPEHRAADEEAKAKELRLKYFNIPWSIDPKDDRPIFSAVRRPGKPSDAHSLHGSRSSRRLLDDSAGPSRRLDRGSGRRGSAQDRSTRSASSGRHCPRVYREASEKVKTLPSRSAFRPECFRFFVFLPWW